MFARVAACLFAVALLAPAGAVQLTTALELGPPTVRLEASEVLYATRSATIELPQGETFLQLPLDELGLAPGDLLFEVTPADAVALIGARSMEEPIPTSWLLRAERPVVATISLTYPMEGLKWAVAYAATLAPDGCAEISASLRVTNELGHELTDALLLGDHVSATLSLDDGQSITVDQPWLSGQIRAESMRRHVIYDRARHGDAAVELLEIAPLAERPGLMLMHETPSQLCGALPAGRVRIYAATEAGPEFIRETALPYTPAGMPLELNLGPASGVVVTRTLESSREVDKRLDVRDRVALFDLLENWLIEVRNLRETPLSLQIHQHHAGYWRLEEANHSFERPDAETLVFEVEVEPGRRAEIAYRLRHLNRQP